MGWKYALKMSACSGYKILQINASDKGGGAAQIAFDLHQSLRKRGHTMKFYVNRKLGEDPDVQAIPEPDDAMWKCFWNDKVKRYKNQVPNFLTTIARWVADPGRNWRRINGLEEFNFPAFRSLDITPFDLIHCHVLHGNYFDLHLLMQWSAQKPVIITLHDAWLLAGHCAHSFDCEKWLNGCKICPDITIPVPLERDNAATNWKRKREIFQRSKLYVAAPSKWLLTKAKQSILSKGTRVFSHIPHGVDLELFRPQDKMECRATLGLPVDAFVFLFAANGIRKNRWKDYDTWMRAVRIVAQKELPSRVIFLALGQDSIAETFGNAEVRFISFVQDRGEVARYYAASNVYVHPARAETFPNAILEALASGVPVVASAVGGIPEQVKSMACMEQPSLRAADNEPATGILVPAEDAEKLAAALELCVKEPTLTLELGRQAHAYARAHFNHTQQADQYEHFYQQVLEDFRKR